MKEGRALSFQIDNHTIVGFDPHGRVIRQSLVLVFPRDTNREIGYIGTSTVMTKIIGMQFIKVDCTG